jgi:hypothetical protein
MMSIKEREMEFSMPFKVRPYATLTAQNAQESLLP